VSLPYLPLYIDDYEAGTAHLSLLEDGAYSRLLRLCWRTPGCKIPSDEAWIFRKLRATTEAEHQAIRSVIAEFFKTSRGTIFSPRLLKVHVQVSVSHLRRKEAGKTGGKAKAQKTKDIEPSNAVAMPKQPEPEPEPIRYSDTNVSGDDAEADFAKQVFDRAVAFLGKHGTPDKAARSLVGKLRKTNTDAQIFEAFAQCSKSGVVDPVPWLVAKLNRPKTDLDAAFAQFFTEKPQ
jgi:uncharacterized protein YdaU (DUF1376 family)